MLDARQVSRYQRELKAMVRNVGANDPEAFAELVALAEWLTKEGLPAAAQSIREQGHSWADIARPLGVTRAAAFQRFGRPTESAELQHVLTGQ